MRDHELEHESNWDYEQPETHEPVKNARAVVSVSFPREDFERVASAAQQQRMKTSEFIREAALERTRQITRSTPTTITTSQGGFLQGGYTAIAAATSTIKRQDVHHNDPAY